MKSKVDKLKEIGELLSSGAITQAEFVRLKSELLIEKEPAHQTRDVNEMYTQQNAQKRTAPPRNNDEFRDARSVVIHHNSMEKKANGFGITGFVLALIGGFVWYLAIPFAVLGLIFSIIGMSMSGKTHKKGLAIAGFVISLVLLLIMIIFILLLANSSNHYYNGRMNQYY
jgi:hypothetical protein